MSVKEFLSDHDPKWEYAPHLKKWRKPVGVICRKPKNYWEAFVVKLRLWEFPIRNRYVYKKRLGRSDRINLFGPVPKSMQGRFR